MLVGAAPANALATSGLMSDPLLAEYFAANPFALAEKSFVCNAAKANHGAKIELVVLLQASRLLIQRLSKPASIFFFAAALATCSLSGKCCFSYAASR